MNPRIEEEFNLLRTWFGERLEYRPEGHWVKVSDYSLPCGVWTPGVVEVAFQIPAGLPGQAPYAFHVRPMVSLVHGGTVQNCTGPTSNPWGDSWWTFSWVLEPWQPGATPTEGTNMLDFARSIADRFREGA